MVIGSREQVSIKKLIFIFFKIHLLPTHYLAVFVKPMTL